MATLIWVGGTSTDSTTVANWTDLSTGSPPSSISSSDVLIFRSEGAGADCVLNQTTLGIVKVEDTWNTPGNRILTFNQASVAITHLELANNTTIKLANSTTTWTFSGNHDDTSGEHAGMPVIFQGSINYDTSGRNRDTLTFILQNATGTPAHLTTGNLPNITLKNNWSWDTPSPLISQTYGVCEIPKLIVFGNCTFTNTNIGASSTQKHIQVTGEGVSSGTLHLQCAAQTLDFSNAKLTIDAKNGQPLPCTNDTTNFGAEGIFRALLEDLVVGNTNGNGNKVVVPEGLTLECASLEIQSGSQVFGGGTNRQTSAKSHIHCIERPKIRGTWNFEETSDGIYTSAFGVSSLSSYTATFQNATILRALTVEGLVATPEGLEFTPTSVNPGGTAANTLWLNSGDSNKLYHGSSAVGSGGGGSGTVTSIATSAPITGGTITATGTIGISAATTSAAGSMSGADKTKLDGIEASADVTDATNVAAAGALMDSELTDLAGVKGITISTLQVKPSEGAFANGDKTKLDGIAASANNYVHPNHSGEVTSTADGATVIADNVVDEANLKVSNAPTNGYALTAQSAASGGLTWAAMSGGGGAAPAIEDNSGTPAFATGITKAEVLTLLNVEDGADATDATNVSAAGAVMAGQAGSDPYNPANPPNWAGAPPADLETAIQRIAAAIAPLVGGAIP